MLVLGQVNNMKQNGALRCIVLESGPVLTITATVYVSVHISFDGRSWHKDVMCSNVDIKYSPIY